MFPCTIEQGEEIAEIARLEKRELYYSQIYECSGEFDLALLLYNQTALASAKSMQPSIGATLLNKLDEVNGDYGGMESLYHEAIANHTSGKNIRLKWPRRSIELPFNHLCK